MEDFMDTKTNNILKITKSLQIKNGEIIKLAGYTDSDTYNLIEQIELENNSKLDHLLCNQNICNNIFNSSRQFDIFEIVVDRKRLNEFIENNAIDYSDFYILFVPQKGNVFGLIEA
jgi:hypothetical protein